MSYSKIGLTAREKEIWPPKKPKGEFWEEVALVLILLTILATVFHFTQEMNIVPEAHAETGIETKSDREQEIAYCTAWNKNQTTVSGATNMQIARHCTKYLN